MFSLHEKTQRRVCRTAFVLVCAVPMLCTIAWVLYFHRPWQERDWQTTLANALHVRATVSQVSASRPLQRELYSLRLADLQSADPLLEMDVLHIGPQQAFSSVQSVVHHAQLSDFAEAVAVWLSGENFEIARFQAERVLISSANKQTCELKKLRAESKITASGARQIVIQARVGVKSDRVQLVIERSTAGKVQAALDTGQAILPAWLLANVVPGAGRWQSALFSGVLRLARDTSVISGIFRGSINSIDTKAWIGTDSLQALANLQLEELSWRENRIVTLKGSLETSAGQISSTMLKSFQESLYCIPTEDLAAKTKDRDFIKFDKLACRFQLDATGLVLRGNCVVPTTDAPGCIMLAQGRPLIMQPNYQTLPAACLAHPFWPRGENYWFPATREAADMADKLPLPEAETKKQ